MNTMIFCRLEKLKGLEGLEDMGVNFLKECKYE